MKKTVLIFSATRHLFETTISWEVKLLSRKYNVVVLYEYPDVPVLDGVPAVPFYRPHHVERHPPFIRSFYSVSYYKKLASHLINTYQVDTVVIHQDNEFYTNYFIRYLLKKNKIKIILRRPSVVIDPQHDFSWQRSLGLGVPFFAPLKHLLIKMYFDIFLSILFTGKPLITRTVFWPTNQRIWANRKKRIYDVSICYSDMCSEHLSTIYEDSQAVMNPLLREYHCNIRSNINNAVLFIASNDIWAIMSAKGISREEAVDYVNNKINEVARAFVARGLQFHIRYKKEKSDISFFEPEIKKCVRLVDNHVSLYEQVKEYTEVAGFVTTGLWMLAINQAPHKIYSFQLIDTAFYNYYLHFHGVCYVKLQEGGYKLNEAGGGVECVSLPAFSSEHSMLEYI